MTDMQINAQQITVAIDGYTILSGVDVSAGAGETVAIVGPSGSGKTTLLNALGGLLPITAGTLTIGDADATRWGEHDRRRFWQRSAAFILQDYGLVEDESAGYNVTLRKSFWGKAHVPAKAIGRLDEVGLAHRASAPVRHLSGGEKRRVAIARAMYRQAAIIFADEPTASLDEVNRASVQELLLGPALHDTTVIISTHDLELASACDRTITLQPQHV